MTDRVSFTVRSITNGYLVVTGMAEHYCSSMDEMFIYIEREIREMLT
jgi:hypothetical protein